MQFLLANSFQSVSSLAIPTAPALAKTFNNSLLASLCPVLFLSNSPYTHLIVTPHWPTPVGTHKQMGRNKQTSFMIHYPSISLLTWSQFPASSLPLSSHPFPSAPSVRSWPIKLLLRTQDAPGMPFLLPQLGRLFLSLQDPSQMSPSL